jgi:hypothetical protein
MRGTSLLDLGGSGVAVGSGVGVGSGVVVGATNTDEAPHETKSDVTSIKPKL